MLELVCHVCNSDFKRTKGQYDRNIKLGRINVCSKRCAVFAKTGKLKDRKCCAICAVVIKSKFKHCEKCIQVHRDDILNTTILQIKTLYKDKTSLAVAAKIRGYAKTIYNASDKPKYCVNCGYSKHYEVCHIRAVKTFPDDATMREVHALDNLIALCPNCHWEFDNGLLNIESERT